MKHKDYRGFTLMELLISVVILAAILSIGIVFIRSSTQDFQFVSKEYTVQNAVRSSVDNIGNVIKEATAIFTVGKNKFDPEDPSKMTDGWSYIGLSKDKTRLINYVWVWTDAKNKKGIRKEIDITPSEWNIRDKDNKKIEYRIGFYRDEDDLALKPEDEEQLRSKKMIRMSVKGTVKGTGANYILTSDILAENLNQIMDSKDRNKNEPITALAYKVDSLEDLTAANKAADAAFVFVVDISGSMDSNMYGGAPATVSDRRISILRRTVSKFIDELEKVGTVDLYFVPFSSPLYGNVNSTVWDPMREVYRRWEDALSGASSPYVGVVDSDAERLKSGAQEILNLYEGLAWGETKVAEEAALSIQNVKDELQHLKGMGRLQSMGIWDINHSYAQEKIKSIRDLSKYCLQMLQLPFSLGTEVPGMPNAQAQRAKAYVQQRLMSGGGTNVGGGIREGYRLLQKSLRKKKFLMVLSDGDPNRADFQTNNSGGPLLRAPIKPTPGVPSEIEVPFGAWGRAEEYIKEVMSSGYGMNIKNPDGSYFIDRTFLVGFSALYHDKQMMKNKIPSFSQAGGGTKDTEYMDANSETSLAGHFQTVVETVQEEIWYFEGP